MAINPATKNFMVQRRADFPVTLTFKDGNGDALNLTGYTVAAQVYTEDRSTLYASFGVTYTNRTTGTVEIKLTDSQTATFTPNELNYDVLLTQPNGDKFYYLEGKLFISEGYTT
tara:strand:- start:63 stop:404 length:342 start_codon:yes stop_codon:yes gene_type:complete